MRAGEYKSASPKRQPISCRFGQRIYRTMRCAACLSELKMTSHSMSRQATKTGLLAHFERLMTRTRTLSPVALSNCSAPLASCTAHVRFWGGSADIARSPQRHTVGTAVSEYLSETLYAHQGERNYFQLSDRRCSTRALADFQQLARDQLFDVGRPDAVAERVISHLALRPTRAWQDRGAGGPLSIRNIISRRRRTARNSSRSPAPATYPISSGRKRSRMQWWSLSGAKRRCPFAPHMSAFDPKRTFRIYSVVFALNTIGVGIVRPRAFSDNQPKHYRYASRSND